LVQLDLDRRPALLCANDLQTDGEPVPTPIVCGPLRLSCSHRCRRPDCRPCDSSTPMPAGYHIGIVATTADKLRELTMTCRARKGAFLFLPESLVPSARVAGVQAMAIPAAFDDPQEVALACAGYVSAGQVK
jgi:hypothetical protein